MGFNSVSPPLSVRTRSPIQAKVEAYLRWRANRGIRERTRDRQDGWEDRSNWSFGLLVLQLSTHQYYTDYDVVVASVKTRNAKNP